MQKLNQGDTCALTKDFPKEKLFTNDLFKLIYKGPIPVRPGDEASVDDSLIKFSFITDYGRYWDITYRPQEKNEILEKIKTLKDIDFTPEFRLPREGEQCIFESYFNTGFSEMLNGDTFVINSYTFERDNIAIDAIFAGKPATLIFDKKTISTKEGLHLKDLMRVIQSAGDGFPKTFMLN